MWHIRLEELFQAGQKIGTIGWYCYGECLKRNEENDFGAPNMNSKLIITRNDSIPFSAFHYCFISKRYSRNKTMINVIHLLCVLNIIFLYYPWFQECLLLFAMRHCVTLVSHRLPRC